MAIPWNGNIPQPANLISISQGQLLTNNQTIAAVFNDIDNGNFTKFLVQNAGEIAAAMVDPVSAIHTVLATAGSQNGKPIPYFKNSNDDYPLMPSLVTNGTAYSFQIGEMVFKFGIVTLAAGFINNVYFQSGGTINLGIGEFPTNCFTVIANVNTSTDAPSASTITINTNNMDKTGFTVQKSSTSRITSINFIAIGN